MENDLLLSAEDIATKKFKIRMKTFLFTTIIFFIISLVFISLYIYEKTKEDDKEDTTKVLKFWNNNESKKKLVNYIKTITKEDSKDFIKKEDRIAVFDFDGTLFQETDPVYTDYKLFKYRVLDDLDYSKIATDEQKEIAHKIEEIMKTHNYSDELDKRVSRQSAKLFYNMTVDDFYLYIKKFASQPSDGYNNLTLGEGFYKPMLQVIEYLQKNDFIVYIVSGSDRFLVRALIDGHINVPNEHIIGTEVSIIASHQGEVDGLDYSFTKEDELIFNGTLIQKNLNMNKVYNIIKEIGKIPILSFGNSSGDSSMANYVLTNAKYKTMAFMLLCDDLEREYGNEEKAKKMEESCKVNNWIPVSMKNDWTTIYGKDVTKKKSNN